MEKIVNKLLVITLSGAVFFGFVTFLFRNARHDSVQQDNLIFDMCEYIDIDLQRLPVSLIPYDESRIRIEYKNDLPLDFELGDNRLSITESKKIVVSLFAGRDSEFGLTLYLPEQIYREISVYTGTGNVNVGRVDSSKMTIGTETGDIYCGNAVSLMNLSTTSGYISVDFDYVVSETEILSRNGDVLLKLPEGASAAVDFETDEGQCLTNLNLGNPYGNSLYSFNGGKNRIHAIVQKGTLTIG